MIAAGAAVVKTKEAPARPIMNDVIEIAKTIQHPVRGILLRYYMMKKLEEIMPDRVCKYGG
jgi:vacuolar protein sorting-associated protein 35